MKGTWTTTDDHPAGHLAVIAVIAAVLLGSGAAAAVASVIVTVVIIVGALFATAVVGLGVLVVYRVRAERRQAPPVLLRQLPGAAAPAVDPPGPRELHNHWHFHGTDPEQLAGIIRRGERPE
jgi:hypothetical protein